MDNSILGPFRLSILFVCLIFLLTFLCYVGNKLQVFLTDYIYKRVKLDRRRIEGWVILLLLCTGFVSAGVIGSIITGVW